MYIKLTNSQKRTAELFLLSLNCAKTTKRVVPTEIGAVEPESQAIIGRVPGGWVNGKSPQQITEALIKFDPEIDMHLIGKPVRIRSLAYLDEQRKPSAHFRLVEEKLTADGVVKETKPYKATEPNIELPVQISPKGNQTSDDLVQKFVMHKIYQVVHLDGLSFDFLLKLCQEIQPLGFVRVNGGIKGNEPLILRREGLPAFAYLRGRVDGDKYCCTLHLTHTELKAPTE
ncbi:MAG: hypothetical protein ABS95_01040 [Verrucomicrobia bacterium SCN 57-15]|nr:MAG: hypothetical protein ABS95_01040 [Verrucomicrobia bacterium SCN 57-15]